MSMKQEDSYCFLSLRSTRYIKKYFCDTDMRCSYVSMFRELMKNIIANNSTKMYMVA